MGKQVEVTGTDLDHLRAMDTQVNAFDMRRNDRIYASGRATATRSSTTRSGRPRTGTERRAGAGVTGYPVTLLLVGRDLGP